MKNFLMLLVLLYLISSNKILPDQEKEFFGENADLTREEFYDSLEQANFFLEKCCVNSNFLIVDLQNKLKRDTVIFKVGDTLWGTLGIKDKEEAIKFAERFHFKYFFNDWGDLIVLIPKNTEFVKDWYPVGYNFEKNHFVNI